MSRRLSISDRLKGTFTQARKDTAASVQRRTSSAGAGSSKQSPILRIREWLDTCNAQHENHCSGGGPENVATFRPVWLIDVVERCVVRAKSTERYIALSYVWGTGPRGDAPEVPTELMRGNLDAFQLGLVEADIPQTILDAMWLSKKLGIRHLWVDRYCIIHDDAEEREAQVRHMGFIFANAYLTIVSAYGDAYTGLQPLDPRRSSRGSRTANMDHSSLILDSKWNTRGWTLQELLYSRRAVFFFEDLVTWECHCDQWRGSTSGFTKMIGGKSHDCQNQLSSAACGFRHAPWPDLDEFARIATDYSTRRLSTVDDSLQAFSGITHIMSRVFPGGFAYGMPLMFLDIALLWRPQASIRRRAVARPPFLPSWSWMGWWFDGIAVDLNLWRASADYIEDTPPTKRGLDPKRFQPSHSWKIKPTVKWKLTDRAAAVAVPNTGMQYRDLRSRRGSSTSLPTGWRKDGSHFIHDSDDLTLFKYPVPVEDPPKDGDYAPPAGEAAFPGPFLSFKSTSGFFDVNYSAIMAPRDVMNPPIAVGNIWNKSKRWAGEFRAHDGWLGVQSSNYDGDEKLEFVAISTAAERRGSYVMPPERFEENMDADETVYVVNVLWIERIGGVAYRRGLGHVLQKTWDAQAKDESEILLG